METQSIWNLGNRDNFTKNPDLSAVQPSVSFVVSQFLQWKIICVVYFTLTVYSYSEDLIRAKVSLCATQSSPCSAELLAEELFEIMIIVGLVYRAL